MFFKTGSNMFILDKSCDVSKKVQPGFQAISDVAFLFVCFVFSLFSKYKKIKKKANKLSFLLIGH